MVSRIPRDGQSISSTARVSPTITEVRLSQRRYKVWKVGCASSNLTFLFNFSLVLTRPEIRRCLFQGTSRLSTRCSVVIGRVYDYINCMFVVPIDMLTIGRNISCRWFFDIVYIRWENQMPNNICACGSWFPYANKWRLLNGDLRKI